MGANFLQWPHQGAKNSTREGVPSKTVASKFVEARSRTAEAEEVAIMEREDRRSVLTRTMFAK